MFIANLLLTVPVKKFEKQLFDEGMKPFPIYLGPLHGSSSPLLLGLVTVRTN